MMSYISGVQRKWLREVPFLTFAKLELYIFFRKKVLEPLSKYKQQYDKYDIILPIYI